MRFFSAAEIDGLLTFPRLIDALADAFRGDIVTPVRHHHEVERPDAAATLLLMPAWTAPEASPPSSAPRWSRYSLATPRPACRV